MANIKLSHMNHWKTIPYKQIDNFRDYYYEDKSNLVYFQDWDRILRYHKALGYDGIELAPWDMHEMMALFGTPENFRDFAADHGLKISGMFHGVSGAHIAENFDAQLQAGKNAVDLIARFGGETMGTCPNNDYASVGHPLSQEEVRNVGRVLDAIGEYAVDHGVRLGIHNEFFCSINKDNHRYLLEVTDPRYTWYYLDTAQISIIGEDLLKFYDDYHDRMCGFHLKDTADPQLADSIRYSANVEIQEDGHRWFWEPGQGVLDFPGLWELMKKYEFKGWVSVEDDGTPDLLASMALDSYYVHQVLKPIYW